MLNPKDTHRVVLSTEDVMFLITECQQSSHPGYKAILKRIAGTHSRIIHGVAKPFRTEKETTSEKLGFSEVKDKKQLRLEAWMKYQIVPREQMGVEEIEMAEAHMYSNDLFPNAKELDDYEIKHGLKFNLDDPDADSDGVPV